MPAPGVGCADSLMSLPHMNSLSLSFNLFALAALLAPGVIAAPANPLAMPQRLKQTQRSRHVQAAQQSARQSAVWWKAMQAAITDIQRRGAGGYSTEDAAHDALHAAFTWNEPTKRLVFNSSAARPSFCSGAVYAAVLSALLRWDAAQAQRFISPEAWQALAPSRVPDGEGPWGWANANGPGFALLVHRLRAGASFTDWALAQPSDVMKIWWTDEIGAKERGHLVILVRDEGETVRVWSSHQPQDGNPGGFGFRTYPKSAIRRVLFTRITNPAAFNRATAIGEEPWLMQQTERSVSWEDCLLRCGVRR